MEHKFDATFTAFSLLTDALEEYCKHIAAHNGKAALDSLHNHADKIAKELVGSGYYEYTPRKRGLEE